MARVHPEVLRAQKLPDELMRDEDLWPGRYRSIRDLESHLHRNGTRVIKFFLHLSKKEQRKRFLERLDHPKKNWKFSLADIQERGFWREYMEVYGECMTATTTEDAPGTSSRPTTRTMPNLDHHRGSSWTSLSG